MHELAIIQNILNIIDKESKEKGFKKVISINLVVGEVSGVIPACLHDFFPYASKNTIAEGAALAVKTKEVKMHCKDCGYKGKPENAKCPACSSRLFKIVEGREFYIDSLEVQ